MAEKVRSFQSLSRVFEGKSASSANITRLKFLQCGENLSRGDFAIMEIGVGDFCHRVICGQQDLGQLENLVAANRQFVREAQTALDEVTERMKFKMG